MTRSNAVVLIGTTKGLFTVRNGEISGPMLAGEPISSVAFDRRRDRILAGAASMHWGPQVRWSDDGGATWQEAAAERQLRFPPDTGASLAAVWQLATVDGEPDVVYAGVEPAALFRSEDAGESFTLLRGLWEHPHRSEWQPGGGGLCLHTVVLDPARPDRIYVAISTGGVYRSDDAGASWKPHNRGVGANHLPEPDLEFGQCVHKIAMDAEDSQTLYLQNHGGVYRSDDAGDQWVDIAGGLPSDFGFPMVSHPHRGGTAYVIPLVADSYRCTPEGRMRVYRTRDRGSSWEPLSEGLPQRDAHLCVLRDAFCHDGGDPLGLYVGTRTGELYASSDEGQCWRTLAEFLPPILCVRAAA